jgi:hypothetical protein
MIIKRIISLAGSITKFATSALLLVLLVYFGLLIVDAYR